MNKTNQLTIKLPIFLLAIFITQEYFKNWKTSRKGNKKLNEIHLHFYFILDDTFHTISGRL